MKKLTLLAIFLLLTPSVFAQTKSGGSTAAAIEAQTRQTWQDFKDGKKDAFGAALTEDATQVWADNKPPRNKATALKDMSTFKIESYALSDMKVTMLDADAAMVTYLAKVSMMAGGQKMTPNLAVTEVWVKRTGEWKNLRYQESEIK